MRKPLFCQYAVTDCFTTDKNDFKYFFTFSLSFVYNWVFALKDAMWYLYVPLFVIYSGKPQLFSFVLVSFASLLPLNVFMCNTNAHYSIFKARMSSLYSFMRVSRHSLFSINAARLKTEYLVLATDYLHLVRILLLKHYNNLHLLFIACLLPIYHLYLSIVFFVQTIISWQLEINAVMLLFIADKTAMIQKPLTYKTT